MFEPSPHIKRELSNLGRTSEGKALIAAFEEAKNYYSSINSIDKSRSTDSQIEGRQLFCELAGAFIKLIEHKKHRVRPGEVDSFE